MKKIGVMALLVLVSACGSDKFDRDAIRATVVLEGDVKATCVLLEVRDPADKRVLGKTWLPRAAGNTELRAAIFKASLPTDVELAARPYLDGSCANNTEAQTPNGSFVTGTASFAVGQVVEAAKLTLLPGTDADGDGYVGTGAGGADCNDGEGTVKPGAVESCTDQVDLNCDTRKGCEASSCAAQSCFGPPTAVAVTIPSPLTAGTCTSGGTVTLKDATGVNSRVGVDTSVSLRIDPANSVRFYSDAACTTQVTSVTIPANTSSASFFVEGRLVGNATVTAAVTGLTDGTQAASVNPGAGNRLAFQSSAQTVTAGVCSPQPVRIQNQDVQGNSVPVSTLTSVSLSATPNTNFKFYSDAACANEVTSVNIATQTSTASFYFRGTRAGSVTLEITATGFTGTSQAQTINAAAPTAIVIAGPVTVAAATCSAAISATLQDPFGNPATATTSTQLNLISSNAQLALFSNNTCTTTASNLIIAPGAGSRDFFVRATQAAAYSITATGSGLTNGTVSVTVTAGPPTVLFFTATAQSPLPAGVCSGIVTVQQRDANANPVIVASPTTVSLSASSQGPEFFTSSTCTGTPVTATSIAAGASTASFYFKGTKTVSNAILTASVNGLTGTQTVTITAAPPAVLLFTQLPTTSAANACMQVSLQVQDSFGNLATFGTAQNVSVTANPAAGFTFHTNTSCGTPATQISLNSGQSSVNFSARGTKAGQITVTAALANLTSAVQNVTITPLPASKLVFLTPARIATAGSCSDVLTVQSSDTQDNASPVTSDETVVLSQSGTPTDGQFRFYSDSTCTTAVTSITIPSGAAVGSFYFRGERARTVTVTADAASFAAITQAHTVTGADASSIAFSPSTPQGTVLASDCSSIRTVESFDAFANPSGNALTLSLSGTPQAEFFSNATCTNPITQLSIPAGSNTASFYFKGLSGGLNVTADLTLTVTDGASLTATQTEAITPTVRTGTCSIAAGTSSVNCTIAPALASIGRAFLVFQATTVNTTSGQANVRCVLNGTAQVRCEQGANATAAVTINWSVAEFPSNPSTLPGVTAQHRSINCSGDTTSVTGLSAVVQNRAFLLLSSRRDVADQGNTVPRVAELTSTTAAEIRKTGGCGGGGTSDTNNLQVVDYPGALVQRGETDLLGGATNKPVGLSPAVDTSRSILLYSWLNDGSGAKICDRMLRGDLSNNGQNVRFFRGDGDTANCAGSGFSAIAYEVVEFPVGTVVQQVTRQLAATSLEADVTITAVDRSRTLVIAGGQYTSGQVHGEGRHSASELVGEMRARASLVNNTTLRLTRESANASATFTVYVVQLKP